MRLNDGFKNIKKRGVGAKKKQGENKVLFSRGDFFFSLLLFRVKKNIKNGKLRDENIERNFIVRKDYFFFFFKVMKIKMLH